MGEDAGAEGDLLVEIALREAVAAQLELGRVRRVQVRVEDTEGVEVRNVVAAHLVCADEELDLTRRAR